MSSSMASKVVLITGSSSGLGRAIALAFAAQGAKLIVCADLSPDARAEVAAEADETTHDRICRQWGADRAVYVKTDVTVAAQVEAAVKLAAEKGGALHVMVNNAGAPPDGVPIHAMSDERFEQIMRVNANGPFYGCKYAIAQFLKQDIDANGHRGWIINVASIAGVSGLKTSTAYCASKHAVVGLTRAVALDCAQHRIHVNALCPGFINTAMTQPFFAQPRISAFIKAATPWPSDPPPGHASPASPASASGDGVGGSLEEVARAAVFLASDAADWITGIALPVDGGFSAG